MRAKLKASLFILTSTLILSQSTFAHTPDWGKFVLQVGGFSANQGNSQNIGITGLIGDHYSVRDRYDTNILFGLGYFRDGYCANGVEMMYGINAFYLAPTRVKGEITQEQLFTNLGYNYTVTNIPVYLQAKSQLNNNGYPKLTLDIGVGPNVIRTSSVHDYSIDGGITIPDRAFKGKTSVALSGTVGIGLKFDQAFGGSTPLECGYRFFYLGEGRFSKRTSQLTSTLTTGNSYANAVICSVAV